MAAARQASIWTKSALHQVVQRELRGARLIVVSHREPYIHRRCGDGVECTRPAGGLTAALDPMLKATGGVWVAHGSGDADREVTGPDGGIRVPPERPRYRLRRVWVDRRTEKRFCGGLANQALWPLCHAAFHQPQFHESDWESYRRANELFADAVVEEAGGERALVFVQDYHFGLLPRMLKERNPDLTVAQFWHIPWPNRDVFRTFPWKRELIQGLLGNDLLGFHLPSYCTNFIEAAGQEFQAGAQNGKPGVWHGKAFTRVLPFPISIDFERHTVEASGGEVSAQAERWKRELGDWEFLGIGIDRADYTKGIPERMRALDRLLEAHPEYRGRLVFLQVAVPTRREIGAYRRFGREVRSICARINRKWAREGWEPIRLCERQLPQSEMMALHRLSDFCMVTSLDDGMNLVAKEYAASRADDGGVLILSEFAGAAKELTTALLVNPLWVDAMAGAVHKALSMGVAERARRMRELRDAVKRNNIYTWAANIMKTLGQIGAGRSAADISELAYASGL